VHTHMEPLPEENKFSKMAFAGVGSKSQKRVLARVAMVERGFTLVELLVVIAIIGILASFLMPALKKAMQSSVTIACNSNQKQVALGIMAYSDENNGHMPDYGQTNLSYWTYPLADFMNLSRDGFRKPNSIFYCPGYKPEASEIASWTRTYGINPNVISKKWAMKLNLTQKPSTIVLYGDKMPNGSDYILVPSDTVSTYWGIWGTVGASCGTWGGTSSTKVPEYWRHNGGVNFAFADGHAENKRSVDVCRDKTELVGSIWAWFNW